ncbi:VWA domain-containing protein [Amycolatopsis pittospori]|uniref:VWA domain-containing protein n=1 Tax=Amycolatopsis pittospori TaxID=2749434 RepID=UPI0015F0B3A4|nr:VWA domain-containing protein [Amycolatopsis pittospori]
MSGEPSLGLEVHQNKFLAEGDRAMTAIVRVVSRGGEANAARTAAEVLLIDCSSSMRFPSTKIGEARRAAAAAIDVLPDGVRFAVVQGTDRATMLYPAEDGLVTASEQTRAEARAAVEHLAAVGGTAMGAWLTKARDLFERAPDAVRHAILLTDGRNDSQTRADLMTVLNDCEGRFVCDARGIGDGWEPAELTQIGRVLRGNVDSVVEDDELADDFRQLVESAMTKVLPEVRLRIGTMPFSRLRSIKQVFPDEYDLTDRCQEIAVRESELSLGAFSGDETRDYQVILDLDPDLEPSHGQDRQLAWAELVPLAGATVEEDALAIAGRWTHDPIPPTLIDPIVGVYQGKAKLGEALTLGGDAHAAGDHATAAREWGAAFTLATAEGDEDTLRRLNAVVEVLDAEKGIVRVRDEAPRSAILHLVIPSRVSEIAPGQEDRPMPEPALQDEAPPTVCADCSALSPSGANFCVGCGEPLAGAVS